MDAIDFGYATEIVRKNRKSKAQKRGRRVDAEGRPLRSSKKQKIAKVAVVSLLFGGFGG
jgi:translation elongation factor EF-Ts